MIAIDCPNCGKPVATFARICGHCDAPIGGRRYGIMLMVSLIVLVVAVGVGIFAVMRWHPLATESQPPTTGDFAWLTTAMTDCDSDAEKAPGTLHFLVIPLMASPGDAAQWRSKSINDVGNGILLPSDDVVPALKAGGLTISAAHYVFSVRDEDTQTIYKWSAATGVKRFSTTEAEALANFKVQFLIGERTASDDWGATFVRRKGNCYWVNAVIEN